MNILFKALLLLVLLNLSLTANSLESNKSKVLQVKVISIADEEAYGSAVIVSNNGDLVTAYHVINNAKNVEVIDASGKSHSAIIGKVSVEDDLAYLHIKDFTQAPAKLDNNTSWSEDIYSLSGEGLLLKGIVSKKNKNSIILNYKVPHGNSGGGVFNGDGKLIAIVSRTSINEGITYATTVDKLNEVTEDFKYQKVVDLKSNNYDYSYCSTKKTINTWTNLAKSDDIKMHTLHAIFLGLCEKVKRKDMTTEEADYVFFQNRKRLFNF
ncbi:secreted protein [Sulfurimonas gotlandica GD1]|uniref:Secreted protein n=1 Tax=Sulfurimonas gotlandica (strain DSM 19862 / JCM 16533 / GD1) TaxID=929558 RepID=H1FT01_SULGG|nr:secreted protein [Sulfurimonas gotlandica GD1]